MQAFPNRVDLPPHPSIAAKVLFCKKRLLLVQGLADGEPTDDLTAIEGIAEKEKKLKDAKLCRGFKQMYAKPGKKDPVHRTSPQEQVCC